MDLFREILSQAKRRVDAWGGQLYFVYLPEWARYNDYTSWGKSERSSVLTMVESLGIPIVDIDPAFQATGDPCLCFHFVGSATTTKPAIGWWRKRCSRALSRTSGSN